MITDKDEQTTLIIAYEFMYAEYKIEQRRKSQFDPHRLQWLKEHILRLQVIMRKILPKEKPLDFTGV